MSLTLHRFIVLYLAEIFLIAVLDFSRNFFQTVSTHPSELNFDEVLAHTIFLKSCWFKI